MKKRVLNERICLSDYGLAERMTVQEVEARIVYYKGELGNEAFYRAATQIYSTLRGMKPGTSFCYGVFFENVGLFLTVVFRFMCDHQMDYVLAEDGKSIRRLHATPSKVVDKKRGTVGKVKASEVIE